MKIGLAAYVEMLEMKKETGVAALECFQTLWAWHTGFSLTTS